MASSLRLPTSRLQRSTSYVAPTRRWHRSHPTSRGQTANHALVLRLEDNGFDPNSDFYKNLTRQEVFTRQSKEKPTVRVRLSVHYRVHSRQMLCIGGSQIPFGWSFLSIAKVPMTWNQGDVWICEVELPLGSRIEYKYVILEEQDWTKQIDDGSEGVVEVEYRSASDAGRQPDVTIITKQMAIVAWQPGPNRIVQVPTEAELQGLKPGAFVERVPAKPTARPIYEGEPAPRRPDPFEGTWEVLYVNKDGSVLLDRHDVWGWPSSGPGSQRPPSNPMRGFNFGS